ncbi:hypothetical protein F7725_021295 [Dissostichus mawsoni]|uniref:G-protein coupled receptors family 1 profile domain-containing protein n=1 Tax=Dissostichus mawsoni TaxID=36200 RepID=A0A7J5YII6_DISMA|nr:hypothetical protein F7725_021295 [Dissostichus mawsoni]
MSYDRYLAICYPLQYNTRMTSNKASLFPILFSYMRILRVCFSGSKQTRQKAVSTCTPHLVSLLNFSFGCGFEILKSRFDMSGVPSVLRIILSLYFLIIQPLMNPVMNGLQMSKLRNICKHMILMNLTQVSHFTLDAYFDVGLLKYVIFLIILALYVCIIGANTF